MGDWLVQSRACLAIFLNPESQWFMQAESGPVFSPIHVEKRSSNSAQRTAYTISTPSSLRQLIEAYGGSLFRMLNKALMMKQMNRKGTNPWTSLKVLQMSCLLRATMVGLCNLCKFVYM